MGIIFKGNSNGEYEKIFEIERHYYQMCGDYNYETNETNNVSSYGKSHKTSYKKKMKKKY